MAAILSVACVVGLSVGIGFGALIWNNLDDDFEDYLVRNDTK